MLEKFKKKNIFYCFSPEVMLGTFLIEIALALYVLIRYKTNSFVKTSIAMLMLLATFQFAEYQICEGSNTLLWSRIGFTAITLLPLFGLYLVSLVTGKAHFLKIGVFSSLSLVGFFIFHPTSIANAVCGGNYIIFDTLPPFHLLYGFYYFIFLGIVLWEAIEKIRLTKKREPKRYLLLSIIIGYLSFIIPMAIAYLIYPEAKFAIPSIMCGFAITFALILALKIIPLYFKTTRVKG